MYIYIYIYIFTYIYIYIYIFIFSCICIRIYIYSHMYRERRRERKIIRRFQDDNHTHIDLHTQSPIYTLIHALFFFLAFSVYFFDIFSRSLTFPPSCTRIVARSVVRLLSYALTHSVFLFLSLFLSLPLFSVLRTHTLEFLLFNTHTPNTYTHPYFSTPMCDCVYVRVRVRVRVLACVFSTLSPFLLSLNSSDCLSETLFDPYHSTVTNHIIIIYIFIYIYIHIYIYV